MSLISSYILPSAHNPDLPPLPKKRKNKENGLFTCRIVDKIRKIPVCGTTTYELFSHPSKTLLQIKSVILPEPIEADESYKSEESVEFKCDSDFDESSRAGELMESAKPVVLSKKKPAGRAVTGFYPKRKRKDSISDLYSKMVKNKQ